MKIHLIICFFVLSLLSCNGLGPRDTSHDSPVKSITELADLPGVWYATRTTYKMLKEKNYKIDSVRLILHRDSSFEFINMPDCIDDPAGKPIKHQLLTVKGKWKPEEFKGAWEISMAFDKGELFETKTHLPFDVFYIDSEMVIMYFIGDPDQADVLVFRKRN